MAAAGAGPRWPPRYSRMRSVFSAAGTLLIRVPPLSPSRDCCRLSGIPDCSEPSGAAHERAHDEDRSMLQPRPPVPLGAGPAPSDDAVAAPRHDARIDLDPSALRGVAASRAIVEALADDTEPHYGISTGFGALATTFIPTARRAQLQASLVRSHAAGSGAEVEREVVRALMLLRLSTLLTGRTGARPQTVETYAALLNAGITPVVHEYGSLGCSGDLAPLAHCALAAMGEGPVRVDGELLDAADALAAAG